MRKEKTMQINLLEYRLAKTKTLKTRARIISLCCLSGLLILGVYYSIYDGFKQEKTRIEALNSSLKEEREQLLIRKTDFEKDRSMIKLDLAQQLNQGKVSILPPLNFIYTAAGMNINIGSIIFNHDEVTIAAYASNSAEIKRYIDEIDSSGYFGSLNEFKIEGSWDKDQIKFSIKIPRRY